MDCSMPGLPVPHYLLEFVQIHVHWIDNAIQPFHLLLPSSPLAFNLSQHQGLFQWVGSFPVSQLFASGSQSIRASASASVLPMNIQDWFRLGLTSLIFLLSKRLSRVFSNTTVQKHQFFGAQLSLWSNCHIHTWLLEKPELWLQPHFVGKVMCLLFNTLSRFVTAFLPRSKCPLIWRLQSPSAVILEPKKRKVCHCFRCFLIYLPWSNGTRCRDLNFLNVEF